jgi:hypothetical protein
MGWHYILTLKCTVLPEFVPFIEKDCLRRLGGDTSMARRVGYALTSDSESDEEWLTEEQKEWRERMRVWREEIATEKATGAKEYEELPKKYKDLVDIWRDLDIDGSFYDYTFDKDSSEFSCEISKKVTEHVGDLRTAYEEFLRDIIVPITSRITSCAIQSDDHGDMRWVYTDTQLRNVRFSLQDKIKCIEHVFSEDGNEILETRVIYKRSIDVIQRIDLDREYGVTRT